ncbi:hypothetical protein PAEH1_03525 [Paenalcaligenes hominis]|uniref:Uncharacterized protein n=1 Tax=Paenalcaligenes hominis TaxID=643674 RepID=A0A1U9JYL5_9BURK|nr:hypothetical protein PAEH1_03525 [Paenalcaligenes hominis]
MTVKSGGLPHHPSNKNYISIHSLYDEVLLKMGGLPQLLWLVFNIVLYVRGLGIEMGFYSLALNKNRGLNAFLKMG